MAGVLGLVGEGSDGDFDAQDVGDHVRAKPADQWGAAGGVVGLSVVEQKTVHLQRKVSDPIKYLYIWDFTSRCSRFHVKLMDLLRLHITMATIKHKQPEVKLANTLANVVELHFYGFEIKREMHRKYIRYSDDEQDSYVIKYNGQSDNMGFFFYTL